MAGLRGAAAPLQVRAELRVMLLALRWFFALLRVRAVQLVMLLALRWFFALLRVRAVQLFVVLPGPAASLSSALRWPAAPLQGLFVLPLTSVPAEKPLPR
jgi:hypothetical protein